MIAQSKNEYTAAGAHTGAAAARQGNRIQNFSTPPSPDTAINAVSEGPLLGSMRRS